MRIYLFFFGVAVCSAGGANADIVMRPTFPGSNIPDMSKPALVKDGNVMYESYPATTMRDYSKPSYVEEKNGDGSSTIYEAFPSSNIPNKMKGGYKVEGAE